MKNVFQRLVDDGWYPYDDYSWQRDIPYLIIRHPTCRGLDKHSVLNQRVYEPITHSVLDQCDRARDRVLRDLRI